MSQLGQSVIRSKPSLLPPYCSVQVCSGLVDACLHWEGQSAFSVHWSKCQLHPKNPHPEIMWSQVSRHTDTQNSPSCWVSQEQAMRNSDRWDPTPKKAWEQGQLGHHTAVCCSPVAAPRLPDSHSPLGVCEEFGPWLQGGLQKWKKRLTGKKLLRSASKMQPQMGICSWKLCVNKIIF